MCRFVEIIIVYIIKPGIDIGDRVLHSNGETTFQAVGRPGRRHGDILQGNTRLLKKNGILHPVFEIPDDGAVERIENIPYQVAAILGLHHSFAETCRKQDVEAFLDVFYATDECYGCRFVVEDRGEGPAGTKKRI